MRRIARLLTTALAAVMLTGALQVGGAAPASASSCDWPPLPDETIEEALERCQDRREADARGRAYYDQAIADTLTVVEWCGSTEGRRLLVNGALATASLAGQVHPAIGIGVWGLDGYCYMMKQHAETLWERRNRFYADRGDNSYRRQLPWETTEPVSASSPSTSRSVEVDTHGPALRMRSGPSTSDAIVGELPDSSIVVIDCYRRGDMVVGKRGTTDLWNRIAGTSAFVSDGFLITGDDDPVVPAC